jgi:protein dithiol oxidoreductase (disulfide-forming)
MKYPIPKYFFAALFLILVACTKNEPVNAAAAPNAKSATTIAPVAAQPSAEVSDSAEPGSSPKQNDAETPAIGEQVAETEEVAESAADAAAKASKPVLKLAQLPPRTPANSRFKEGVHYQRLSPTQPVDVAPDQVQITEVFWYGCPHCNALDPHLEAWRKSTEPNGKPSYVVFTRLPAAWNDATRFHGRFYYAAESLGRLDELHPLIFREIHVNGNPLNTIDKAREFFAAHGVDAKDFQKNFGALSIERKLDDANLLAQRYRTAGVPHLVVNGKYITDVGLAGGEEQLLSLLNELAAREHARE